MEKIILYSLQAVRPKNTIIFFDLIDLFNTDRLESIRNDCYCKKEFAKELKQAIDHIEIELHQGYYSDYCVSPIFIKTNFNDFYDKTIFPLVKYKEQGYKMREANLTYNYYLSEEEAQKEIDELKTEIENWLNEIDQEREEEVRQIP
jgi:hypothetical protein